MIQDNIVKEVAEYFEVSQDLLDIEEHIINEKIFDLQDKLANSVVLEKQGNVTYHNEPEDEIYILNYEKLIQSLPEAKRKDVKHCDFIISCKNNFIICNELSFGKEKSKWPKAWKQMQSAIQILNKCDVLKNELQDIKNKLCIFSCRKEIINSPMAVADAFSIPFTLIKIVEERNWHPINSLGFKVFESDIIYYKTDKTLEFKQNL